MHDPIAGAPGAPMPPGRSRRRPIDPLDAGEMSVEGVQLAARNGSGSSNCLPDCLPDCGGCDCSLGLLFLGWLALTDPAGRGGGGGGGGGTDGGGGGGTGGGGVGVGRLRPRTRRTLPGRAGAAAIRGYRRWLSPRLPTRCRHTPTCSAYGLDAVDRYGLLTGTRLIAGRLNRCRPGTPHGTADPVP